MLLDTKMHIIILLMFTIDSVFKEYRGFSNFCICHLETIPSTLNP
jgi:hypothetical protein